MKTLFIPFLLILMFFGSSQSSHAQMQEIQMETEEMYVKDFVQSIRIKRLIKRYDNTAADYHKMKSTGVKARIALMQHTLRVIIQYALWKEGRSDLFIDALMIELTEEMKVSPRPIVAWTKRNLPEQYQYMMFKIPKGKRKAHIV
ncbi:hypothetical protein KC929_01560 [Patescibacteria group bacterium]|nr:hypothetical protein [Patescibacteria group bacterium]